MIDVAMQDPTPAVNEISGWFRRQSSIPHIAGADLAKAGNPDGLVSKLQSSLEDLC